MQAEQQSERERFEAWYDKWIVEKRVHTSLERDAWDAWQARAALSHPSPQGWQEIEARAVARTREECAKVAESEICSCCWPEGFDDAAAEIATAIRALGERT